MRVPNVYVFITALDGRSWSKIIPSYEARLLKLLWKGKIDGEGIVVEQLPSNAHISARFTEIGDPVAERGRLTNLYGEENMLRAFPDETLDEELLRQVRLAGELELKLETPPDPIDERLVDAGCTKEQAESLRDAGLTTLEGVEQVDYMVLCSVTGMTPGLAMKLQLGRKAEHKEPETEVIEKPEPKAVGKKSKKA